MIVGAGLRLGNLSEVAVEHFDEAVYASNLLFPAEQGGEYPFRQLYAPPLLPAVIEWTTIFGQMLFGDVPTWWPMLPALVAGLVTIPSLWWIVRQWFSPRAGIIAAMLIALHEFHAAYCRTALTDIPLTLFVLWAVHWFWLALQSGRTRDAVIAGVFTALAWWTKYNGWLPLAIVGSGGALWQIVTPAAERNWRRLTKVWMIGAATAFVLWLPVLWDCQQIGGYAAVAANHRQYVDGFAKWGVNLWRGVRSFDAFGGFGFAVGLGLLLSGQRWLPRSGDRNSADNSTLASGFALAWFCGLLVATPCYFPYPRLWQPWVISGVAVVAAALPMRTDQAIVARGLRIPWLLTFAGICFTVISLWGYPLDATLWESRSGAMTVAKKIRSAIRDHDAPVFVHSEPAVWFHLRQHGSAAVIADGLTFLEQPLRGPAYLVVGAQAERDPQFEADRQRFEGRLELIDSFEWTPSRIVILDQHSPSELAAHPELRTQTVRLYRVR